MQMAIAVLPDGVVFVRHTTVNLVRRNGNKITTANIQQTVNAIPMRSRRCRRASVAYALADGTAD